MTDMTRMTQMMQTTPTPPTADMRIGRASAIATALALALAATLLAAPLAGVAAADDQPSLDDLLNIPDAHAHAQDADHADGETNDNADMDAATDAAADGAVDAAVDGAADADEPVRLGADQTSQLFEAMIGEMRSAAKLMREDEDAGARTQRLQDAALRRLEQIIAQAESQQQGGSSSKGQQQQDQGAASAAQQNSDRTAQSGSSSSSDGNPNEQADGREGGMDRPGGGDAVINPFRESRTEWGNLPPRLRDELVEGANERFSPVYRQLTEWFYKRVAEETK